MRFVILHYHILKNAGSTVEEILYRNFRERLLRYDIPDRDEQVTQAHLLSLLQENPHVSADSFSSPCVFCASRWIGSVPFTIISATNPPRAIRSANSRCARASANSRPVWSKNIRGW
jgi:hypothetical protein